MNGPQAYVGRYSPELGCLQFRDGVEDRFASSAKFRPWLSEISAMGDKQSSPDGSTL